MAEVKRCPTCGAQNASSAEWCTLCLSRFDGAIIRAPVRAEPELVDELSAIGGTGVEPAPADRTLEDTVTPEPVVEPSPPEAAGVVVVAEEAAAAELPVLPREERPSAAAAMPAPSRATTLITPPPPPPVSDVPVKFLRDGERVRWVCPTCETVNDIDLPACRICGTVMARLFAPAEEKKKPDRAPATSMILSAVLPGLGHVTEGNGPTGASRAVLYLWTLGISLLLLIRPPAKGRGMVRAVGVVFAIAAAAVWAMSLVETRRLSEGDRTPLVSPRTMTYISAGLTIALFLGLAAAAFGRA